MYHIAERCSKRKYVSTFINGVAAKLQLDTVNDISINGKTAQGRCFVMTAAIDWIELFELLPVLDSVCKQVTAKSVDQQFREF